ncbi:DUF4236 domain-containing protein [Candidatus Fermentibacteria bacterium]|nr:DUF4236 domain-containing protein [Candidatus Fermentibacteria bacterium]
MGLFLRKAFSSGPVRLNLSKGGLGVSGGAKGARVSLGPSGVNLFGGRGGLYYRKRVSGAKRREGSSVSGCLLALVFLAVIAVVIAAVNWLGEHPWVAAGLGVAVLTGLTCWLVVGYRRKTALRDYRAALEGGLVSAEDSPSEEAMREMARLRERVPHSGKWVDRLARTEGDVYQALMDRVLEDGVITEDERRRLRALEDLAGIPPEVVLSVKLEVFQAAYMDAVADRRITEEEYERLRNLASGLEIPAEGIRSEMSVVEDIRRAQDLEPPLEELDPDESPLHVTRNETLHLVGTGQVYTRRRDESQPDGWLYSLKRDGELVLTDRRLRVEDSGTTTVKLDEIEDLEVDLDRGYIFVSKADSGRPTILSSSQPVRLARMLDLLAGEA